MPSKEHWEHVYQAKTFDSVSWFQEHAHRSLELIRETEVMAAANIIDVGGGASTLADDLIGLGYTQLTVLDLSGAALLAAQNRLREQAKSVTWIEGDVTQIAFPAHAYDVWHDRAVFHFLTERKQREAYLRNVLHAVKPRGWVVVATFAEDGPERCSGLPVMRYSAEALHRAFGPAFTLIRHAPEAHRTPFGTVQEFVYCLLRKVA